MMVDASAAAALVKFKLLLTSWAMARGKVNAFRQVGTLKTRVLIKI